MFLLQVHFSVQDQTERTGRKRQSEGTVFRVTRLDLAFTRVNMHLSGTSTHRDWKWAGDEVSTH